MPRLLTRLKGLARLFLIGLPKLLRAALAGRNTRWWRCELHRLALGRGLLLENVLGADSSARPKRALLSYLVEPFVLDPDSPRLLKHGNRWRGLELARLLDELGYIVDVIDHDDGRTRVPDRYDLLLGQGRSHELAVELGAATRKVFLGTAPPPRPRHDCIRERTARVNQARGCGIGENRTADEFPLDRLHGYDALACLGGPEAAAAWDEHFAGPIHTWQNHAYDRFVGAPAGKDFGRARSRFLFFGTRSQILCGLDLALEVLGQRPNLELWVCGPFAREEEFVDCFRRELYETPNIHPVGWVEVGGKEFEDLTRRCGFVIAPMCPTFSHGSLVICAGAGLVPLAPAAVAGIDTDRLGTTLPSLDTDAMGRLVDEVSSRPAEWLRDASTELVETVRHDFSQAAFSRRFRAILEEVTR